MGATDGARVYGEMRPDPRDEGYEADARRHSRLRVLAVLLFALFLALALAFAPEDHQRDEAEEIRRHLEGVPMAGEQDGSQRDNP